MSMKKVAVIMGSDSDLPVLKGAFDTLRQLEIPFEAHVYSAHRTPAEAAAGTAPSRQLSRAARQIAFPFFRAVSSDPIRFITTANSSPPNRATMSVSLV